MKNQEQAGPGPAPGQGRAAAPGYPAAYPGYGYPGPTQSSRWPRYLQFLKKYWWIPLLTLALGAAVAAVKSLKDPPQYRSAARMWVSGKLRIPEGTLYSEELQFFFGTQVELMQSEKIRSGAATRVQTMNPSMIPCAVTLQISQAPKSSMFLLFATGEEPTYTQAYLNAVIEEYLTYKKQVRANSSEDTLNSLSEQVYQHEKELKAEQEKLTAYQKENNIAVLQEQGTAAAAYLSKLSAQLSDLKLEDQFLIALGLDSTNNAAGTNLLSAAVDSRQISAVNLTSGNNSTEATVARQQLQLLRMQKEDLAPFLRPKHPKLIRLDEEIARVEKLMALYQKQSRDQVEPARQALQVKVAAVQDAMTEWEGKLQQANRRLAEYEGLKANVTRVQTVYDKLLTVLQSVDVNKNLDQEIVSVMEHASVPRLTKVTATKSVLMGCVAGLVGGLMLVFLVARMDDRLTSMTELTEQFEEEIVGQVPDVTKTRRNGKLAMIEPDDDRHIYAESYRNIRSSLLYMPTEGARPKTILVTSAVPNEGKSTVAANLARTMAFAGAKVLLIDADMRKGKLHQHFDVDRAPGFSDLLHDTSKPNDFIVTTPLPNLFFIPAGDPIPDATERFLSPDFEKLLKELHVRYDQIIFDCAPVFAADDAPTLAPKMDGVLFILRGGFTRAGMARQALEILYQRQSKVLGLVFNRANSRSNSYYYYRYADYYNAKPKG